MLFALRLKWRTSDLVLHHRQQLSKDPSWVGEAPTRHTEPTGVGRNFAYYLRVWRGNSEGCSSEPDLVGLGVVHVDVVVQDFFSAPGIKAQLPAAS